MGEILKYVIERGGGEIEVDAPVWNKLQDMKGNK